MTSRGLSPAPRPDWLGVVLAGGRSTRFGSDKALAEVGGQTLLAHAVERLGGWCGTVVVAGRAEAPEPVLADRPHPGLGPLGGLAAALHHAQAHGFAAVLSCAVDSLGLPDDLPERLSPAPAYVASQPVIGLWPVPAATALDALLDEGGKRSLQAFAKRIDARPVELPRPPANINAPSDLTAWLAQSR